ncbi:hypothetical protein [Bartonella rattimassiliensis]|nr:hypothetical protein [Bartonella rattimassiliensis]
MWLINYVASYGHAVHIVRDMQRNIFPDQRVIVRPSNATKTVEYEKLPSGVATEHSPHPISCCKANVYKSFKPHCYEEKKL